MSSQTLTIRIPRPMREEILSRAESAGTSAGEAARQLLAAALESDGIYGAAEAGARAGVEAALAGGDGAQT
jgi:hypothetical protein